MTHERGRRAQVVLDPHEYELLQEYALEKKQSVSAVIHETVRKFLLMDLDKERKRQAVARIAQGDAPVKDWPEMERELEARWEEPLDGQSSVH
jgi:hypothetical protein